MRRSADVGFAPFLGLTKTDCCQAAACRIGAHSQASGQAADRGAGQLVAGRAWVPDLRGGGPASGLGHLCVVWQNLVWLAVARG